MTLHRRPGVAASASAPNSPTFSLATYCDFREVAMIKQGRRDAQPVLNSLSRSIAKLNADIPRSILAADSHTDPIPLKPLFAFLRTDT